MRRLSCLLMWIGAPSLVASTALAQTAPATPNIGDVLKQTQPPAPPPPAKPPQPEITEQQAPLSLPEGETLTVQAFQIEGGGSAIPEADLQAELASYKGRALSLAEIQQAAGKLTALYRARGFVLARAYVPKQDATAGTLIIRIQLGKVGEIKLQNHALVRDSIVKRAFGPLQQGEALSRDALERSMLLVSDMPGAALPTVSIGAGQAPGTSDLSVDVPPSKRLGGYAAGDNQGSRYTGRPRLSAGLDVNSPFGLSDKLSGSAMGTSNGDMLNGRLAYGFPLAGNGLRGEVAASKTTYTLGSDYADLDATGRASSLEGTLSYPLQRSQLKNLYVSLNLASRRMRDDIGVTDTAIPKRSTVANLALQREAWGSLWGRGGYANVHASLSYGQLNITDATQATLNRAGAQTEGHFGHLNVGWVTNLALTPLWSLGSTGEWQQTLRNKNLDSSEQFNIGGSNGVKAYREVVSGDNGYVLGLALRRALPGPDALTHSVNLFADLGHTNLQNGAYSAHNGARIADVGLGYDARYKNFFSKLQLAHAVGPTQAGIEKGSDARVLLQVGVMF